MYTRVKSFDLWRAPEIHIGLRDRFVKRRNYVCGIIATGNKFVYWTMINRGYDLHPIYMSCVKSEIFRWPRSPQASRSEEVFSHTRAHGKTGVMTFPLAWSLQKAAGRLFIAMPASQKRSSSSRRASYGRRGPRAESAIGSSRASSSSLTACTRRIRKSLHARPSRRRPRRQSGVKTSSVDARERRADSVVTAVDRRLLWWAG